MSCFKVLKAGIISQIQDLGRFSYTHIGVSSSGASDEYAYNMANLLLDNTYGTNVIEISFSGLKLESLGNTVISITGADMSFSINELILKPWSTYEVKKGDILSFNKKKVGQKAYLAVKDGFVLKKDLGSYSTNIKEKLGFLLKDEMNLDFKQSSFFYTKRLKQTYIPKYEDILTLRVLMTYQADDFTKEEKESFFSSNFTLSNESNSMGAKLDGDKLCFNKKELISEGIAYGSIQIPNDGRPIILLKQRQSIGGYPKIATVLSIDCFKLAQVKSKTKIVFKEITLSKAQKKVKNFQKIFFTSS